MADRYAGMLPPGDAGRSPALAWALSRRRGAGARRRGGGDAVPPDPGRAHRARVRPLASGEGGRDRQGRGAIETLGEARTVLFDKTGTLTVGTPDVREIVPLDDRGRGELLRLAASVDRVSTHVLGEALSRAAAARGCARDAAGRAGRSPGRASAASSTATGCRVGSRAFLVAEGVRPRPVGGSVAGDRPRLRRGPRARRGRRELSGVIVMADELRPDAAHIVERLRDEGVRHVAMVSGDRRSSPSASAARSASIACTPNSRRRTSSRSCGAARRPHARARGHGRRRRQRRAGARAGRPGDRDGRRRRDGSSETADAVITVDRVDRWPTRSTSGRRALPIARQSVLAGMGLASWRWASRRPATCRPSRARCSRRSSTSP